ALRSQRPQLYDGGHWLHRRPLSLGIPGGKPGRTPAQGRLACPGTAPATGVTGPPAFGPVHPLPKEPQVSDVLHAQLPIINRLGLHARASAKVVSVASRYNASIRLRFNNREV